MEGNKYPFYGVQFHPEKQAFNFAPSTNIQHDPLAITFNRYFADFFVNECRQNTNKFQSYEQETDQIVENYKLITTPNYNSNVFLF